MEIRFRLCFKTPLLSLDLRIIKVHFREIFWDRTSVQSFLIIGVYKWLFIVNCSGTHEDLQEDPVVDTWTVRAEKFNFRFNCGWKLKLDKIDQETKAKLGFNLALWLSYINQDKTKNNKRQRGGEPGESKKKKRDQKKRKKNKTLTLL